MRLSQLDAECRYVHHLWESLVELSKRNIKLTREDSLNQTPDGFTWYKTIGLNQRFDDWFESTNLHLQREFENMSKVKVGHGNKEAEESPRG
jgi:hypothetical protein